MTVPLSPVKGTADLERLEGALSMSFSCSSSDEAVLDAAAFVRQQLQDYMDIANEARWSSATPHPRSSWPS